MGILNFMQKKKKCKEKQTIEHIKQEIEFLKKVIRNEIRQHERQYHFQEKEKRLSKR